MPKVNMERLDERVNNIHTDVKEIKELLKTQNGRVRKLENWRNYLTGMLAIMATICGFIIKKL